MIKEALVVFTKQKTIRTNILLALYKKTTAEQGKKLNFAQLITEIGISDESYKSSTIYLLEERLIEADFDGDNKITFICLTHRGIVAIEQYLSIPTNKEDEANVQKYSSVSILKNKFWTL